MCSRRHTSRLDVLIDGIARCRRRIDRLTVLLRGTDGILQVLEAEVRDLRSELRDDLEARP